MCNLPKATKATIFLIIDQVNATTIECKIVLAIFPPNKIHKVPKSSRRIPFLFGATNNNSTIQHLLSKIVQTNRKRLLEHTPHHIHSYAFQSSLKCMQIPKHTLPKWFFRYGNGLLKLIIGGVKWLKALGALRAIRECILNDCLHKCGSRNFIRTEINYHRI